MREIIQKLLEYYNENPDQLKELERNCMMAYLYGEDKTLFESNNYFTEEQLRQFQQINNFLQSDPKYIEAVKCLIVDFIDYYGISPTSARDVYDKVIQYFPKEQFKRVLCVGDGIRCHLGRRLASEGYQVWCMDPLSDTNLENSYEKNKGGSLRIFNDHFHRNTNLIQYVDVIVGSKIPDIAFEVVCSRKPYAMTISTNPGVNSQITIHNEKINNYGQMNAILRDIPGTQVETGNCELNVYMKGGNFRERNVLKPYDD